MCVLYGLYSISFNDSRTLELGSNVEEQSSVHAGSAFPILETLSMG